MIFQTPPRQVMLGNRTPVRIVSEQSTSRPGCILELDAMVEADHDWKQTQFLHVFQQQLLTGYKLINNIATPSNVPVADQTVPEVVPTSQRKGKLLGLLDFFFLHKINPDFLFSATLADAINFQNESHGSNSVSRSGSAGIAGFQ